jgi:hypothetical protein
MSGWLRYTLDNVNDKRADISNTLSLIEKEWVVKPRTLGFRYKKSF